MKKLISLLLAATMLLTLLTGCGSKNDKPAEQKPADSKPASSAAQQEEVPEPRHEELRLTNGDKSIYGEMYLPAAEQEKYPTVILSHGFGGASMDNKLYAEAFAKAGYAAYIFDFCGGGRGSQSDGDMTEMSVLTEAADLSAVMDQVKALDYVDADHLFLMGQSQGGFVSSYVAAQRPDEVAALVLYYPAFALQDGCRERNPDPETMPDTEVVMNNTIGKIYTTDALSFDIYEVIGGYKGDVQILHGDKDATVPYSYSEKAVDVYENATLTEMKGCDHGFTGKAQRKAADLTLEFLNAHK